MNVPGNRAAGRRRAVVQWLSVAAVATIVVAATVGPTLAGQSDKW